MITIRVVSVPSATHFFVGGASASWFSQTASIPPMLIASRGDKETRVEYLDVDYLHQGTDKWGRTRDKECNHLAAKGTIEFAASSYAYTVSAGTTYAFDGVNSYPFKGYVGRGEDYVDMNTWGFTPEYSGDLIPKVWVAEPTTIIRKVRWLSSQHLSVLIEKTSGKVFRDDELMAPKMTTTTVANYWFDGVSLYRVDGKTWSSAISDYEWDAFCANTYWDGKYFQYHVYSNLVRRVHGNTSTMVALAEQAVRDQFSDLSPLLEEHPVDFGDLSQECADQLRFVPKNILLTLMDVSSLEVFANFAKSSTWKPLLSSLSKTFSEAFMEKNWKKAAKHFRSASKDSSGLFLATSYVVRPTVSDLGELHKAVESFSQKSLMQRLHSRRKTVLTLPGCLSASHTAVMTIITDEFPKDITNQLQRAIAYAKRWGMYPELQNLWDVLPWSFVADWFVQYGDFIERVDAYQTVENYFPVGYVIMSEKWTMTKSGTQILPQYAAEGAVEFSYYTRWITREAPLPSVPPPEADLSLSRHLVESTALLVQKA